MKIIDKQTTKEELAILENNYFCEMVKAVVDLGRGIMAVDAELHADLEKALLETGSAQSDLWGINLYPEMSGDDFLEFDSLINIRPYQDNPSRDILNPEIRTKIINLVGTLVK